MDRRREPRYELHQECEIILGTIVYSAALNDVSLRGASITIYDKDVGDLIIGDPLMFIFRKPNYPVIKMDSIIRNAVPGANHVRLGLELTSGDMESWRMLVNSLT